MRSLLLAYSQKAPVSPLRLIQEPGCLGVYTHSLDGMKPSLAVLVASDGPVGLLLVLRRDVVRARVGVIALLLLLLLLLLLEYLLHILLLLMWCW